MRHPFTEIIFAKCLKIRICYFIGTHFVKVRTNFIYVLELKLSNNGGVDAATEQMKAKQYAEPFKADKRKVIALAIELDEMGKGLVDWKEV